MITERFDKAKQQFLSHKFSLQNLYPKKWVAISEIGDLVVHDSEKGLYDIILSDTKISSVYVVYLDDDHKID